VCPIVSTTYRSLRSSTKYGFSVDKEVNEDAYATATVVIVSVKS